MSYLVLARKWRPSRFDEIIGQQHVTQALCNAIRLDRVAHAFLFTGARGVGKTTAARILAKALQCDNGPTEVPCGECHPCKEVTAGNCIDVFEIDGASNRGINEIRELRDSVAYAPQRDRFKIFIIDEVHMLTPEAFNALLKTLEEPPKHVKFIFATTEPQKIPVTILSRCQRYDFKRVPLTLIKKHLESLLIKEEINVDAEGIRMVARESEGSVRDALSLLDRVISFAGESADAKMVADCLGIADRKWLHNLLKALLGGEPAVALEVIGDVSHYGYDLRAFCGDLLDTIRDLIVISVCGTDTKQVELSDAEISALARLSEQHPLTALQRMFNILLKAADEMATSRYPRLVVEMAMVRCCTVHSLQSVPEVLARIEALEGRLASGSIPDVQMPVQPAPGRSEPARPAPAPMMKEAPPQAAMSDAAPSPIQDEAPPAPQMQEAPPAMEERPAPAAVMQDAAPPLRDEEPPPPTANETHNEPAQPTSPPGKRLGSLSVQQWPTVVERIKETDPLLATILENAQVLEASNQSLTLGLANFFYQNQLAQGPNHERLVELLNAFYPGVKLAVERVEAVEDTLADAATANRNATVQAKRDALEQHPATQAVVDAMQGTLIDTRIEENTDD